MCLHKLSLYSPLPERKGAKGMVRAPIEAKLRIAAGVQRAPLFSGGKRGVQRGATPLAASINYFSLLPPFFQEGGQGDSASPYRDEAPNRSRSPEGAAL